MTLLVVGVDPDSERHGIAIYHNGQLVELNQWPLLDVFKWTLEQLKAHDLQFSIENVCENNFVYARNQKPTRAEMSRVGIAIGRCQQSQVELMRVLDAYSVPYALHKPQRGNWSKNRAQFEKVTGWTKRSNADTRSAAFFGWLELRK